jgi:glycosidase
MNLTTFIHQLPKILAVIVVIGAAILIWSCSGNRKVSGKSVIIHPEWTRNAVIYEVNVRQYTPEGTFKAFEQHLPRLKKMGVDILWLMPINPIGIKNRKGSLGSYYSVKDYLGINPEYGTLADFQSLVKKIHALGMHVIIDWVANHTSWDNNLITEHPEWYTHDSTGKIIAPVPDWTDAADLNYDQKGLREYMTNAMIYWVKDIDIDGFRCDVAGMLPISFWDEAVPKVKEVKPVFMLAEWETPEMHDTAFDMTYSWDIYQLMNAIAKGLKTPDKLDTLLEKEKAKYPPDAYRMRFITNHDENSWNGSEYERMHEAVPAFTVLTFCLPGMPLIYTGQESAMDHRLRFFDKDTVHWGDFKLEKFYSTLIQLKKGNKALRNGDEGGRLERVPVDPPEPGKVYSFAREKEGQEILCFFNLSADPVSFKMKGQNIQGSFVNIFEGTRVDVKAGMLVSLKPWGYLVLEKK